MDRFLEEEIIRLRHELREIEKKIDDNNSEASAKAKEHDDITEQIILSGNQLQLKRQELSEITITMNNLEQSIQKDKILEDNIVNEETALHERRNEIKEAMSNKKQHLSSINKDIESILKKRDDVTIAFDKIKR